MPSTVGQPSLWAPEAIATFIYQVVMVFVALAFIWKKYRRPARRGDEEQMIGVVLPIHRTRSRKNHIQQSHPTPSPNLRELISADLEEIIQSALGLNGDNTLDGPSLSFEDTASISSGALDAGSSLDTEIRLRQCSADGVSQHIPNEEP